MVCPSGQRKITWLCRCVCGKEKVVAGNSLKTGRTVSCGCVSKDNARKRKTTHGQSGTRLYKTWKSMRQRCYNPQDSVYYNYGLKGIIVADEWQEFEKFFEWAVATGYDDTLEIDRIDPTGNYTPENCRWVDASLQCFNRNRSTNNTSGVTGVKLNRNRWEVTIGKDGERIYLGVYTNLMDAIIVRLMAERELFGFIKQQDVLLKYNISLEEHMSDTTVQGNKGVR